MTKNRLKLLWGVLKHTYADRVLLSYIIYVLVCAALIWAFEPTISTYRQALWYCYAVISTAGFGDVVVTTFIPKALSVVLTIYSGLVIAIVTGVIVNFYTQMIEMKNKESISSVMDQMERLPELSREELKDLSDRVKQFRSARG